MRVLFLTNYDSLGASSRVRLLQYIPYLEQQGIECHIEPLLDNHYIETLYGKNKKAYLSIIKGALKRIFMLLKGSKYDAVWIEKQLFPGMPCLDEIFLRLIKVPVVVDYDDAVFHNYDLNKSSLICYLFKNRIANIMSRAAIVIAGNDYLADYARKSAASRVEYLPSVVDLVYYPQKLHFDEKQPFTIGWMGTPATQKYLSIVAPVLQQLSKTYSLRLVTVGANNYSIAGVEVINLAWSQDQEAKLIHQFDVGIMPLLDTPWEQGKCGYKLIQYMACGVPGIASPVGVNTQIIEPNSNGLLANTPEEWQIAFETLLKNRSLLVQYGAAARQQVEKNYSLQVTAPRFYAMLCSLTK